MTQRMADLVQAQYSPDLETVSAFIRQYGVDVWVVDERFAKADYVMAQDWLVNSAIQDVVFDRMQQLQAGMEPALVGAIARCSVLTENNLVVLEASCLVSEEEIAP